MSLYLAEWRLHITAAQSANALLRCLMTAEEQDDKPFAAVFVK